MFNKDEEIEFMKQYTNFNKYFHDYMIRYLYKEEAKSIFEDKDYRYIKELLDAHEQLRKIWKLSRRAQR